MIQRLYRGPTATTGIQPAVSGFHRYYSDTEGCIEVPHALLGYSRLYQGSTGIKSNCILAPLALQGYSQLYRGSTDITGYSRLYRGPTLLSICWIQPTGSYTAMLLQPNSHSSRTQSTGS